MSKTESCESRIAESWDSTREALETNWQVYTGEREPDDEVNEDSIYEYGLSFDYVEPGTFQDQNEGYWRYQLSWGGPSDEIRFYASGPAERLYKAEYWFLDWFDGARLNVIDDEMVQNYWQWFQDAGSCHAELEKAEIRFYASGPAEQE